MEPTGNPGSSLGARLEALLKSLSDPARLRILGRLAEGARSPAALAEELALPPEAIARHLDLLREAGLVKEGAGSFLLEARTVPQLLREAGPLLAAASGATPGTGAEGAAADELRSLQRRFFDGPKLRTMPSQQKMKEAVLREILRRLPAQEEYPEKQLNELLKPIYEDFATLRRELVDFAYMERGGGIYRWTAKGREAAGRP